MRTLAQFRQLIIPYWFNRRQWAAWLLLCGTIGFSLVIVQVGVRINEWNKTFYDALIAFRTELLLPLIWQYLLFIAVIVFFIAGGNWLRKLLLIRWRTHLTRELESLWLENHNAYRLSRGSPLDNSDQRIAEDAFNLVEKSIDLIKYFCMNMAKIIAFVGILWQLSGV